MRIFVAGATGTLGRPVTAQLIADGHTVFGLTRGGGRAHRLPPDVQVVVGDALCADDMRDLLSEIRPEVVVHLLTALPSAGAFRASQLRPTNALRIHGTANLIAAARKAGVRRIVAESFVGVHGSGLAFAPLDESAALAPVSAGPLQAAVDALRSLERQLTSARTSGQLETVALRIGYLYGEDVPSTRLLIDQARVRRLFLPRHVTGLGAFVHVQDAVSAIVAAIEHPSPAPVYHVVDDLPIPVVDVAHAIVRTLGLPPPRALPSWLVRIVAPTVDALVSARLVLSNQRARRDLNWMPRYPTVWSWLEDLDRALKEAA